MSILLSTLFVMTFFPPQEATSPPNSTVLYVVEGRGVQIYECTAQAAAPNWVLVAPEATLYDRKGLPVGSHSAGPVWTWRDGSSIKGTVLRKQDSPSGSIPWLLLSALPASQVRGALSGVTLVRRSDTQGGVAPTSGCDATHDHAMSRVSYSATYTFYMGDTHP